jgi:RNase P/RNase MRP subunit p30
VVKFYDLNVKPHDYGEKNLKDIYDFAEKLGFYGIGLESSINLDINKNQLLKIHSRKTLFAENIKDVKMSLRKNVFNEKLIAISTNSRSLASWCARDSRFKIISLNLNNIKNIHKNTIKLASKNETYFEVTINELLFNNKNTFIKRLILFSNKIIEILKLGAKIILASAAGNIFQMRSPKDIIALSSMMGIEDEIAKKAITEYPEEIINELGNRRD